MWEPKLVEHVDIRPDAIYFDGEEVPFFVSSDGVKVEYEDGVAFVTLRIPTTRVTSGPAIVGHRDALRAARVERQEISVTSPFGGDRTPEAVAHLQSLRERYLHNAGGLV
jgi:hypothetical protein